MVKRGRPPADWLYRFLDLETTGNYIRKIDIARLLGVSPDAVSKQLNKLGVRPIYTRNQGSRVMASYRVSKLREAILGAISLSDNPDYEVPKRYRSIER